MRTLKNNNHFKELLRNPWVWLGVFAAIIYSSWPLGFILNPNVAHHAFASQLEASNQPYNWLFTSLDILSGLAILIAGVAQWLKTTSLAIKVSIVGYMMFALLVIVAALAPFNCNSLANSCYGLAHTPLAVIHGLSSIVSVVFLLGSIFLLFKVVDRHRLQWLSTIVLFIIACWGLTGVGALLSYKYRRADENLVQYVFITVCSLSIVLSMVIVQYLLIAYSKVRVKE